MKKKMFYVLMSGDKVEKREGYKIQLDKLTFYAYKYGANWILSEESTGRQCVQCLTLQECKQQAFFRQNRIFDIISMHADWKQHFAELLRKDV